MRASPKGLCALCTQERDLKQSHITPAFVIRWMKQTSATPYLRSPLTPNIPLQGIKTVPLLCADCEELFSALEKIFAEKIFIPFHDRGVRSFQYGDWLRRFAVSMVWRAIAKEPESEWGDRLVMRALVEEAANCWGDFLLGRRKDPGPYDHHLLFWDPTTMTMTGETEDLPDHLMWYILRSADATTILSDKTGVLYGYSKLPQMFFFSGINPKKPEGLKGTLIRKHGEIRAVQQMKNQDFAHFLPARVKELRSHMDTMSEHQRQRIEEKVLADPERVANSKSFEAFLAEQEFRKNR